MLSSNPIQSAVPTEELSNTVALALAEDLGDGDRSACICGSRQPARAIVTAGEAGVLAGRPWFDAVFRQLDRNVGIAWHLPDGGALKPGLLLCELRGPTHALLAGERTALNFLQLLSGVATATHRFVDRVKGTRVEILDTRKTLPGLRNAQKYAVRCGGGINHRFGLYDGILIKENHIIAAGSIATAVERARAANPGWPVQVEVETLEELEQALRLDAEYVLLDNLASHILARAVHMTKRYQLPHRKTVVVEASGDITLRKVREVADTGVDRISIGGLTKHVTAINLSMRFSGDS